MLQHQRHMHSRCHSSKTMGSSHKPAPLAKRNPQTHRKPVITPSKHRNRAKLCPIPIRRAKAMLAKATQDKVTLAAAHATLLCASKTKGKASKVATLKKRQGNRTHKVHLPKVQPLIMNNAATTATPKPIKRARNVAVVVVTRAITHLTKASADSNNVAARQCSLVPIKFPT